MKKLFQNPIVAWAVLILAVALACVWGQFRRESYESKKATELLEVEKYQWVNDSAKMLSDATEATVKQYNTAWNNKYYSVVAVATIPKLNGWSDKDYAAALGEKWTLGAGDMLLLLVKNGDWYVACGDNVLRNMTDTQMTELKKAIDEPYYTKDYDKAVEEFFRKADVFYAQAGMSGGGGSTSDDNSEWQGSEPVKTGHVSIFKVILLIGAIFLIWAIIDRIRYGRYRRRVAVNPVPTVSYYPIFWGRPSRVAAPRPPVAPAPPMSGVYHRPSSTSRPSGSYPHAGTQSRPTSSRPASRPGNSARPGNTSRPGGFGKGGFGGGKR